MRKMNANVEDYVGQNFVVQLRLGTQESPMVASGVWVGAS
jgi:hypothetical protein